MIEPAIGRPFLWLDRVGKAAAARMTSELSELELRSNISDDDIVRLQPSGLVGTERRSLSLFRSHSRRVPIGLKRWLVASFGVGAGEGMGSVSRAFLVAAVAVLLLSASTCQVSVNIGTEQPARYPDLSEGDCVTSLQAFAEELDALADVTLGECDGTHEIEITGVIDLEPFFSRYPGQAEIELAAAEQCLDLFRLYVGIDAWDSDLTSGAIWPFESAWDVGDSWVTCMVHHRDQVPLGSAVRGVGESARADLGERIDVDSLAIGDCVNNVDLLFITGQISVTDCEKQHEAELHHKQEITAFGNEYPGDGPLGDHIYDTCIADLDRYLGGALDDAYTPARIGPDSAGWEDGFRTMFCLIVDAQPGVRFTGAVPRG